MATVTTNDSSVLVTSTQAPVAPIAPAVKRRQVIGSKKPGSLPGFKCAKQGVPKMRLGNDFNYYIMTIGSGIF